MNPHEEITLNSHSIVLINLKNKKKFVNLMTYWEIKHLHNNLYFEKVD